MGDAGSQLLGFLAIVLSLKLTQENDFKGVYIDTKHLYNIQHTFKDIINSMNLDNN